MMWLAFALGVLAGLVLAATVLATWIVLEARSARRKAAARTTSPRPGRMVGVEPR